jgi:hypothetical protein
MCSPIDAANAKRRPASCLHEADAAVLSAFLPVPATGFMPGPDAGAFADEERYRKNGASRENVCAFRAFEAQQTSLRAANRLRDAMRLTIAARSAAHSRSAAAHHQSACEHHDDSRIAAAFEAT